MRRMQPNRVHPIAYHPIFQKLCASIFVRLMWRCVEPVFGMVFGFALGKHLAFTLIQNC